jgi:hypothetical protein
MDESALLGILGQLEQESYGFASGELATQRAYAIERYLAAPYGDEVDGRSQVVDTGLRDTIEWVMPQVLRVFLSGDEVVKFAPTSFEDEQAAKQETEYVNHVMLEKNDAFNVFSTWFRDAMMSKVGYVKAAWTERQDVLLETYQGLNDDTLSIVMADPSVQIAEQQDYPDPDAVQPPMPAPQAMGMGMTPPPQPMLHDVKLRRVRPTGYVKIDNVPPEEIRVHQSLRTVSLNDCLYIQHRVRKTLSEIRQDGYKVPDDFMDADENSQNDEIIIARDRFSDSDELLGDQSGDKATRRVWLTEEWVRVDFDGDGIAELRKICRVGRHILANEETDLVPFAAVTPIVFPHKHVGIGFDDLVNEASRTKTAIARQFLDNLYLANNGRYGVNVNTVNVDDLLVSRPGGVVRVDGDPTGGIQPIQHPVIGQAALEGMQWADSWRENSTGVSAYYQGLNADALNKTATGISQIMTASQGRVEAVTRSFATGVKELALVVHALTLKHATIAEKVKLNNTWTQVDPREWVKRTGMTITVGLGTGTRESRIGNLMQLAQLQAQGLQAGIVTPPNLYHTGTRITEEMGYKNVDEFWTDPSKQPPQQPQTPPEVLAAQEAAKGLAQQESIKQQGMDNRLPQELASKERIAQIQAGKDLLIASGAQAIDLKQATAQVAHKFTELHMDNAHRAHETQQNHAFQQQTHADNNQFKRDTFQPKNV